MFKISSIIGLLTAVLFLNGCGGSDSGDSDTHVVKVPTAPQVNPASEPVLIKDIRFADDNLKSCIIDVAAKQKLTQVNQITSLSCINNNITDLTGLAQLNTLDDLVLNGNHIKDLSAVAGLVKLKSLSVANNKCLTKSYRIFRLIIIQYVFYTIF